MTERWIKTYEKLLKWEWYGDPCMVAMWIHLLLTANWCDKRWRGITIKRGQLLTSRTRLSDEVGTSDQQTRTCLERLQSSGEITCEATNKYTIITICKYDTYQSIFLAEQPAEQPTNNQQNPNKQPTKPQQTTTPIEVEEYNIINKNPRKKEGESDAPAREGFEDFEIFGILHNVKLKPAQYRHLCETYGTEIADETIDDLSCKLADGSVNSADHYATLLTWLRWRRRNDTGPVPMSNAQVAPPTSKDELTPAEEDFLKAWAEFDATPHERDEKYWKLNQLAKQGGATGNTLSRIGMKLHNGNWLFD